MTLPNTADDQPPLLVDANQSARRRIVIATYGSLGDLHPYLAVGLGLQARGHDVVMATGESYRAKIKALGLGFAAVRPDSQWLDDPVMTRRLSHPRWGMVRVLEMLFSQVRESYADLLQAVQGADLVVGCQAVYALRLVAESQQLPWVSVMHIPMGVFSAYDPPLLPGAPEVTQLLRWLGPYFWGPFSRCVKWCSRYAVRPWYRLRKELGLPPAGDLSPITDGISPQLHLALFSRWMADRQPDWPPQTVITGFPWYDRHGGTGMPTELAEFLDAGPPPLVFTVGTAVAADAGPFYERSIAAAQRLGQRAVLILKDPRNRPSALPKGIAAFDYAPFSELFPRAAAVVHHGGIGTCGLSMRAGRPTLVMPCAWDQPDNARRLARLGMARVISRSWYTPARVAAHLQRLLEDPSYAQQGAMIAEKMRTEDGVQSACEALTPMLEQPARSRFRPA